MSPAPALFPPSKHGATIRKINRWHWEVEYEAWSNIEHAGLRNPGYRSSGRARTRWGAERLANRWLRAGMVGRPLREWTL